MKPYARRTGVSDAARIPVRAEIDLTYRCTNRCRHCWLPPELETENRAGELTCDEIISIVDQARRLGCREWVITGGEPMIRPDFEHIFDYITSKCRSYALNTNGVCITPRLAGLIKRKGTTLISLYGGTADVHDHITRRPGSYEAALRGMRYLKEAGADFTMQIVPLADNEHQVQMMRSLADSMGVHWRFGAKWLRFTACGDPTANEEIARQRLSASKCLELMPPNPFSDVPGESETHRGSGAVDYLFAECIASRREFHIDPYGTMSSCSFLKAPSMRYDLRKGSVRECWEEFIPSLAHSVRADKEYAENCGSCELKSHCDWCAAYAHLEHGRYSAKIEYLCEIAAKTKEYVEGKLKASRRFFQLGGLTIQLDSQLPITHDTFHPAMRQFEVDGPGDDNIVIRHVIGLPHKMHDLGELVYERKPYAIYRKGDSWIYRVPEGKGTPRRIAVFDADYSKAVVYHRDDSLLSKGHLTALTGLPSDQVMLAQALARREAFYVHASGAAVNGCGYLFVGHSEAGKSTMVQLLKDRAEVLSDERIIVRKWPDGVWIHGSWNHREVSVVSARKAPLRGICFIKKSADNRAEPVHDRKAMVGELVGCLIRPHETPEWWDKTLAVVEHVVDHVPFYLLHFDKSGKVFEVLDTLSKQTEYPNGVLR